MSEAISATYFANHVGSSMAKVRAGGDVLPITRFGTVVGAMVSVEDLEFLVSHEAIANERLRALVAELKQDVVALEESL